MSESRASLVHQAVLFLLLLRVGEYCAHCSIDHLFITADVAPSMVPVLISSSSLSACWAHSHFAHSVNNIHSIHCSYLISRVETLFLLHSNQNWTIARNIHSSSCSPALYASPLCIDFISLNKQTTFIPFTNLSSIAVAFIGFREGE